MKPSYWTPILGLFFIVSDDVKLEDPLAGVYAIYQTFCVVVALALFVGVIVFLDFSLRPDL